MDLRQLEMLQAVVDCGGYAQAGKRLHVSHSAIHRQLRLLGQEFRSALLVRSGKRLTLTETGVVLWKAARRIGGDLAGVRRQIAELNDLQRGQVRVGAGTHIVTFFLQPVLKRFHAKYPGIDVRITSGGAEYLVQQLRDGRVDLAIFISGGQPAGADDPMTFQFLYEEEFVWAVGKGHPLAGRKSVSYSELIAFLLLIPSPQHNLGRLLQRLFETAVVPPRISMELDSEESIEKMIEIGTNVGLLSKHRAVRDRLAHFRITGQPLFARFELVRPKNDCPSRAVEEFVKMCRDQVAAVADRGRTR